MSTTSPEDITWRISNAIFTKQVMTPSGRRFCPAVLSANGRSVKA